MHRDTQGACATIYRSCYLLETILLLQIVNGSPTESVQKVSTLFSQNSLYQTIILGTDIVNQPARSWRPIFKLMPATPWYISGSVFAFGALTHAQTEELLTGYKPLCRINLTFSDTFCMHNTCNKHTTWMFLREKILRISWINSHLQKFYFWNVYSLSAQIIHELFPFEKFQSANVWKLPPWK